MLNELLGAADFAFLLAALASQVGTAPLVVQDPLFDERLYTNPG